MYLDHHVVAMIDRALSKIDMNIMVLDTNGQVILPEDNKREFTIPEAIRTNPTKPLVYGGFTLIGTEGAQPLYLVLPGDSVDVSNCAVLAAELVNMLTRVDLPHADREQTYRCILREDVEGTELEALASEHDIRMDVPRQVFLVNIANVDAETALAILNGAISEEEDTVVEMDRHTVALIRQSSEAPDMDEAEQFAQALINTFENETGQAVSVGIGEVKTSLNAIADSFEEAKRALNVGRIYRNQSRVFVYHKLLLERFLDEVPVEMQLKYNQAMFNRKTARLFNEEMLHTIDKFFENSLNLSETARQIYIHRNTLVYRLDKVQRQIGLDLRSFDDAVTFKMMMLLGKNGQERGGKIR